MIGAFNAPAVRAATAVLIAVLAAEVVRAGATGGGLGAIGVASAVLAAVLVLVLSDRTPIARAVTSRRFIRALDSGVISVHYQPIVDQRLRRIVAVEALIRWLDPRRGMVSPERFVTVLRGTRAERTLAEFVLERAIGQVARWRAGGFEIQVSVNLPPRMIDLALENRIVGLLEHYGQPPSALHIELTEEEPEDLGLDARMAIGRLRGLGITMSLDDFGRGGSSLSRLSNLPIDNIKIDRAFIADMEREVDAEILRSMISLAHSLGLSVVAEGVETEVQWHRLKAWGCDLAQGYLLCRPQSVEAITSWMRTEGPRVLYALGETASGYAEAPGPGAPSDTSQRQRDTGRRTE